MSNLHDDGGEQQNLTIATPPHLGTLRQFANGSHASHHMAGQNATPADVLIDIDAERSPDSNSLVMLQLASFEGRAL